MLLVFHLETVKIPFYATLCTSLRDEPAKLRDDRLTISQEDLGVKKDIYQLTSKEFYIFPSRWGFMFSSKSEQTTRIFWPVKRAVPLNRITKMGVLIVLWLLCIIVSTRNVKGKFHMLELCWSYVRFETQASLHLIILRPRATNLCIDQLWLALMVLQTCYSINRRRILN